MACNLTWLSNFGFFIHIYLKFIGFPVVFFKTYSYPHFIISQNSCVVYILHQKAPTAQSQNTDQISSFRFNQIFVSFSVWTFALHEPFSKIDD